jgi:hypothetical protein
MLSAFTTVVLAGTKTGDVLWVGGTVGRGARAPGKGRGSSTRRVGMGGEGDENDGMLKVTGDGKI